MIYRFLTMTKFFIYHTVKSRAFLFMVFLNSVISILIASIMFISPVLLKSFVPGNIQVNGLPEILVKRLFNFQWANIMIYIPVLSSAFFGSTAIPYEYERGTIYNLSSLPVDRFQILMSKITGATVLSFLSTSIIVVFQILFFVLLFKSLPGFQFLFYILLLLLVTFSDVCFAVAVSVFFNNSGHSAIAFLIVYLVIMNIISLIATGTHFISPIFVKTNTDRIIYRVFINADPYFLRYSFSLSPIALPGIEYISGILLLYSFSALIVSYIVFSLRRNFS